MEQSDLGPYFLYRTFQNTKVVVNREQCFASMINTVIEWACQLRLKQYLRKSNIIFYWFIGFSSDLSFLESDYFFSERFDRSLQQPSLLGRVMQIWLAALFLVKKFTAKFFHKIYYFLKFQKWYFILIKGTF